MKTIVELVIFTAIAMSIMGCDSYAYSGYNPYNDPLGMTTRETIRERELTKRHMYTVDGDVEMKSMDTNARIQEASYQQKAISDTAFYDASKSVVWATVAPTLVLITALCILLIVAIMQIARIFSQQISSSGKEMIPPVNEWRR